MLDPSRAYYQRQLESAAGLPIRAIQRELERLSNAGLLYRRAEGNRTYYQVDMDHPLFPELRNMVLKSGNAQDRLRAAMALNEGVRLAFLNASQDQVLMVTRPGRDAMLPPSPEIEIENMTSEAFLDALTQQAEALRPYLQEGVDLLGRREDVIWRHIESAGYSVPKGDGVP